MHYLKNDHDPDEKPPCWNERLGSFHKIAFLSVFATIAIHYRLTKNWDVLSAYFLYAFNLHCILQINPNLEKSIVTPFFCDTTFQGLFAIRVQFLDGRYYLIKSSRFWKENLLCVQDPDFVLSFPILVQKPWKTFLHHQYFILIIFISLPKLSFTLSLVRVV